MNSMRSGWGTSEIVAIALVLLAHSAYAVRTGDQGNERSESARENVALVQPSGEQARLIGLAQDAGVAVRWDASRGGVASIRGADLGARASFSAGRGLAPARRGDYAANAIAVLDNVSGLLSAQDARREFRAKRVQADRLGFHHVRVNQMHGNRRIVGAELIVHFDQRDRAYEVNGRYLAGLNPATAPTLSANDATRAAQADLVAKNLPAGELQGAPELVVYARRGAARLAYELTLIYSHGASEAGPGRWLYWVDAEDGRVLDRINNIQHIPGPSTNGVPVAISGALLEGEGGATTNVTGWLEGGTTNYYLFNKDRQWVIKNEAFSGWPDAGTFAYRSTTNWGSSDRAEISAANAIDYTHRYFSERHELNGFNGSNTLTRVHVHQGVNFMNAYWDGDALYIGDGNSVTANCFAVLDVIGHEFTHAVTEFSAGLIYENESGALNESFSDIFGSSIEFFAQADDRLTYPGSTPGMADWLMGEDFWLSSTALRDLRNPSSEDTLVEGRQQPSLYQGRYWYSGTDDNGGVHKNSGVQNFFYYLLSEGGAGTNDGVAYSVPGIGLTNAEQVAFRALTVYCTANTDYRDVRLAWLSAAEDLNPDWVEIVAATWEAVGLQPVMMQPASEMTFFGPTGGPFYPHSFVYTIYNDADVSADWEITQSAAWLDVSPSSGSVAPQESLAITVTVNSASETLPPETYSDTLMFSNSLSQAPLSRVVTLRVLPPAALAFDLNADPGWTTEGEWAFGVPLGLGGAENGNPDPTSGVSGVNVYGINLSGDYTTAQGGPYYLTAGPFDFTEYTNVHLGFARWLNTDMQPFARMVVQISTNNTDWETLWENSDSSDIADSEWVTIETDISQYADKAGEVYIRWGHQIQSMLVYPYSGWNLDDIVFYAASRDALAVRPATGFSAVGYEGGPFSATSVTWTISNVSTDSVSWSATSDAAWLTLSDTGGTLDGGASTTVVGSLELSIADALAPALYSGEVAFSNEASGFSMTRPLFLEVVRVPGKIEVRDSIAPEDDHLMPFGEVVIGATRTETITLTNSDAVHPLTIHDIVFTGFSEDPTPGAQLLPVALPTRGVSSMSDGNTGPGLNNPLAIRWTAGTRMAAAPKILFYADDPRHLAPTTLVDQALQGLGLPYTAIYEQEFEDFEDALTNDEPWDLVIFAAERWPAPSSSLNALLDFVNNGGRLIAHSWKVKEGHPLWAAMGVSFSSDITGTPRSIYWWDESHPLFNEPEQVPPFTNMNKNVFLVYGQNVQPTGDGVALAGYTQTSEVNRAALIVANGGRTIFRGFFDGANSADSDGDGKLDGVELWQNLIHYSLSALAFRVENLPPLPIELDAGESLSFDVAYAPEQKGTNYGRVTIFSSDATDSRIDVELSGVAVPDYLHISPKSGFASMGHPGGPFEPEEKVYTLSNAFASAIDWSGTSTQAWLLIEPAGGTLAPGETQVVTARVDSALVPLAEGVYPDAIAFSNETTGITHWRAVEVTVFSTPVINVSPLEFHVTNRIGESQIHELVISNALPGNADLSVSLNARVTNRPPNGLLGELDYFAAPPGHDFNRVAPNAEFVPQQLLVRFSSSVGVARRNQMLASLSARVAGAAIRLVPNLYLVNLAEGQRVEDALPAFNSTPGVLYAEPNYIVHIEETIPDDARFAELWGMRNTGQSGGTPGADIGATRAWDFTTGNSEIVVAVTDTGIDYNHEDLAANMWVNTAEIPGNGIDDDGNGYVDDVYGVNTITKTGDPMDDQSHGTHCAGTIGAVGNNGVGVAGVTWNVRLMACKFLGADGKGSTANGILAVDYAVANGANVISASWGGGGYSQALKDSIEAAGRNGILFCAAAGNDGNDIDSEPSYPASYDSPSQITVLNTDRNDYRAGTSSYGLNSVDIGAPGSSILSVKMGGGYSVKSGTSMATPHVAGAAALLLSINPMLAPEEIKTILMSTADPTLPGVCASGGRLNLAAAVAQMDSPWISFAPAMASNIAPDSATNILVEFSAGELPPGIYSAEIAVRSNDRTNPVVRFPASMTILADSLAVTPTNVFASSGLSGGPFVPRVTIYTIRNTSSSALTWSASASTPWLEAPLGGELAAGAETQVVVAIAPSASALTSGVYIGSTVFSNVTTGATRTRTARLTVGGTAVWINEVNYDPTDENGDPFIELAGSAGADLSAFQLELWRAGDEEAYTNLLLSGSMGNEGCGFGAIAVNVPEIETSTASGILLTHVGAGTTSLVQFVSYGGELTITNDAFGELTAEAIGEQVSGSADLQLSGTADAPTGFTWITNAPSKGTLNGMQQILPCASDRDEDGLPDWWEAANGLDPTVANPPGSNEDADWLTDWEEYVADTDPLDPNSVFPLIVLTNPPESEVTLIIDPSSTARVYGVLWTTNLLDAPQEWNLYPPEKYGTGGPLEFSITNDAPERSYRTRVRLP